MATLQDENGQIVRLKGWHTVGRLPTSDLRIQSRKISNFHAVVHWDGAHWILKDMGSTNGTWLDGEPIAAGISHPLSGGQTIRFSNNHHWQVRSLEPPAAMAYPVEGGGPILAENGLIGLPNNEQPEASIYENGAMGWVVEREGSLNRVEDAELVLAGGRSWRLCLPQSVPNTIILASPTPQINNIRLHFQVSLDQESIQMTAWHGHQAIPFRSRAHMELLLVLARQRINDEARGDLPTTEHGWLYRDDLARKLAIFDNRTHVYVHRARAQFAQAGIEGAASLIERRPDSGQVRIGVARLEVGQD